MRAVYLFPANAAVGGWVPAAAPGGHRGRYLWTDAFGVLNFITLNKETGDARYLDFARTLVDIVHNVLGKLRDGSARLPGAGDANPLDGGLRIGKVDEAGPDGDGQYHHYLTLWMFALNRLALATGQRIYNDRAIELARAIHPRFVYDRASLRPRMVWKMSTDLSRVLVRSEGNLDPIDGLVVFTLLQRVDGDASTALAHEIADYAKIVRTKWQDYESDDPLDLGMTAWTAHWLAGEAEWADGLLARAKRDTAALFASGYFETLPRRRLAFREFGTALGIGCGMNGDEWDQRVAQIVATWEKIGVAPDPTRAESAAGHNTDEELRPITLVMYAAALVPGAFCRGYL